MARKRFVIIDFHEYEQGELSIISHTIVTMLTTNGAAFPLLPVAVLTLSNHLITYDDLLGAPLFPGQAANILKARKVLETDLRDNGIYINRVGNGNASILGKSGYPLSKDHERHGQLVRSAILAKSIEGGFEIEIVPHQEAPGQRKVANARNYLVLYVEVKKDGTVPEDYHDWTWAYFPKHTGRLTKLKRSTRYRLVATALGTDPRLTFSFPIDRTTQ